MRFVSLLLLITFSSCLLNDKKKETKSIAQQNAFCAIGSASSLGSTASVSIFETDPMVASNNPNISPADATLSQYLSQTTVSNLSGNGTLTGQYAQVVSGICGEKPGSFSAENKFYYNYGDPRLSEVMSYHYANHYRETLDENDFLPAKKQLKIIANCPIKDNAYFSKKYNELGELEDYICMGSSSRFEKADFGHDANVVIHEIQHSITNSFYSQSVDFNQFIYDEAGGLNEAISDFFALSFLSKNLSGIFDSKVFSRWGLGSFFSDDQSRGAHRCPIYDSSYPSCDNYQTGPQGFSLENNTVSYSYPDGMGWPYAWKIIAPNLVKNVYLNNVQQQEIHVSSVIMSGVLYEIFLELKKTRSHETAFSMMTRLIAETLPLLPKPSPASNLSPISYIGFVSGLLDQADEQNWSSGDRQIIRQIAEERGLYQHAIVNTAWAAVGDGSPRTPGMKFIDVYSDSGVSNERLNKGDIGAVWFDIKNLSAHTLGALVVDVSIQGGGAVFLNGENNLGYLNPARAMIQYQKINGSAIVQRLSSGAQGVGFPIGNSYFSTDIYFDQIGTTVLWIQIPKNTTQTEAVFNVRVKPENGIEQNLVFRANIYD